MANNKGITFVEVVVSIALVLIVVVALIATVTQSSVFSRRIDLVYTASYLAQRRVDMLKRLDFDQLPAAGETDIRIGADGNIDPAGEYVRTTEITPVYASNPYLTKVKVSVNRVKMSLDGSIVYPDTGQITFHGNPIIMETLFSDVE